MGWLGDTLGDIGDAVSSGAGWLGDQVENGVEAVGNAVGDGVESVCNYVEKGADWLGGEIGGIPVIGGALQAVFKWVGDVVSGAGTFVGAVVKGCVGMIGDIIGGCIKIVGGLIGGILSGDFRRVAEGLEDIFGGIIGFIFMVVLTALQWVQRIVDVLWYERFLTAAERRLLRTVFHEALKLDNIRIVSGFAGIFSVSSRPFTFGNTIYLRNHNLSEVLVHEATHVWQYQHLGARYIAWATGCAIEHGNPGMYQWRDEVAHGANNWRDLNTEAEAQLLQDIYVDGRVETVATGALSPPGSGVFYEADGVKTVGKLDVGGQPYTPLADEAIAYVRSWTSWAIPA